MRLGRRGDERAGMRWGAGVRDGEGGVVLCLVDTGLGRAWVGEGGGGWRG